MKRPAWAIADGVELADMYVHEAGHAVIAWQLRVDIVDLRFSLDHWCGRLHFRGGMSLPSHASSDRARESAEKDMLIYHGGPAAQRLFDYASSGLHVPTIDLRGVMETCRRFEEEIIVIDEWSEYIEERARVMLYDPDTWARVLALAAEIARKLYLTGEEISTFLRALALDALASPATFAWERTAYTLGQPVSILDIGSRALSVLNAAEIDTVAELLTLSPQDIRSSVRRAGPKTVAEITEAMQAIGLPLAEERLMDRKARVDRHTRSARAAPAGMAEEW